MEFINWEERVTLKVVSIIYQLTRVVFKGCESL